MSHIKTSLFQSVKSKKYVMLMCLWIASSTSLYSDITEQPLGLPIPTEEEMAHIEANWPQIVKVHPNKIGTMRINKHLTHVDSDYSKKPKRKTIETNAQEFELSHLSPPFLRHGLKAGVASKALASNADASSKLTAAQLPKAVNNSQWPSFPPVGNQGRLGSCVAWASTYYQASHEIGMINGLNNKSSFAGVLSPKWTYNILNNGTDGGLNPLSAYNLLSQNGAPSIASFPYDGNYLQWDINLSDWVAAISNRTSGAQLVDGVGGDRPQNLEIVKGVLNNGHVLTFGTFVTSWVFTNVQKDPANPKSPHVGELAASWVNGQSGPHLMTIVGYDDDVWIDVNGNGRVDGGEKGAFLVANSWGANWGNQGFVWISYDAFRSVSGVVNGPKNGRVAAAGVLNSYLISVTPKAPGYKPKLIAQFSLSQSKRNQISVSAGISSTLQKSPTTIFNSSAISFQGGSYEFSGIVSPVPQSATFALDLTDLIPQNGTAIDQRYYLILTDNQIGHPTTLSAFSLIDNLHKTHAQLPNTPLVCDNSEIHPHIDYGTLLSTGEDVTPPVVNLSFPVNGQTIKKEINVTVQATDDRGMAYVELYIDGTLFDKDETVPYIFTVNTKKLSNGVHHFTAMAYDTSGNTSTSSVSVTVKN